jgi:hypothetical protein
MSEFKLTGALKVINATNQVSDKFSKREFVITDGSSMYPQDIMFQLTQDKCNLLDGLTVGQSVEVSFNLRGREWINPQGEAKYFNSLEAWRITPQSAATPTPIVVAQATTQVAEDEDDGLPF